MPSNPFHDYNQDEYLLAILLKLCENSKDSLDLLEKAKELRKLEKTSAPNFRL